MANGTTYGVYQGLQLDSAMSRLTIPITSDVAPGYYTVITEVSNDQNLIYRSVYPDAIYIPLREIITTVANSGATTTKTNYVRTGTVGYLRDEVRWALAADMYNDSVHAPLGLAANKATIIYNYVIFDWPPAIIAGI